MTDPHDPLLALDTRDGLPEAMRVLVATLPREAWASHPEFAGLTAFWLERHASFRRALSMMEAHARDGLDRRADPRATARALSRLGGFFVRELHGHHQIEDRHYFPILSRHDPRLRSAFALLDRDHEALDGHLSRFGAAIDTATGGLARPDSDRAPLGRFDDSLSGIARALDRHLRDEEEIVAPVLLTYGV